MSWSIYFSPDEIKVNDHDMNLEVSSSIAELRNEFQQSRLLDTKSRKKSNEDGLKLSTFPLSTEKEDMKQYDFFGEAPCMISESICNNLDNSSSKVPVHSTEPPSKPQGILKRPTFQKSAIKIDNEPTNWKTIKLKAPTKLPGGYRFTAQIKGHEIKATVVS